VRYVAVPTSLIQADMARDAKFSAQEQNNIKSQQVPPPCCTVEEPLWLSTTVVFNFQLHVRTLKSGVRPTAFYLLVIYFTFSLPLPCQQMNRNCVENL